MKRYKSRFDGRPMSMGIQLMPPLWKIHGEDEVFNAHLAFTAWARREAQSQGKDWQEIHDSDLKFGKGDFKNRAYEVNRIVFRHSETWKKLDGETRALFPSCLRCRSPHRLVTDHIVPVCHRPDLRDQHDNLQTLCWDCNTFKNSMAWDFRE